MSQPDKQSAEDQLDTPIDGPGDEIHHWSRRRQEVGVIVWSSFLAACLAALLFFAFFDPAQFVDESSPRWWLPNAMAGYAVGFVFFWMISAVAATLTSYLLETSSPDAQFTNNAAGSGGNSVSQRRS
jgi:hypothetical protein